MHLHTAVPHGVRRRYSAKVTAILAAVAVATLAVGALLGTYLVASAEDGAVATSDVFAAFAGFSIVVVVNLGIVGILLGPTVARPMSDLAEKAERVREGEFDVDLETDRVDEIGRAYAAVGGMCEELRTTIEDLEAERERSETARETIEADNDELVSEAERFGEVMEACADGDLTQRLDPQTEDEAMRKIAGSFNRMLSELERMVLQVHRFTGVVDDASGELQIHAHEIGQASQSVSRAIEEISDGSSEQTDDLQSAAAEIKELSATIEEVAATTSTIAEESDRVAAIADDGMDAASVAAEEMHEADERAATVAETISKLNEDVEAISESITLIDDIAQQTNMLALNAAIETARTDQGSTGDTGGFDVVADEVQELSSEIQEAVDEIRGTIDQVQIRARDSAEEIGTVEDRIGAASSTVDDLEAELTGMTERIDLVNDSVQEINRASNDQAATVEELAGLVENVAVVSAQTSERADHVAAASRQATDEIEEVTSKARSLDSQSGRLTDVVGKFDVSSRQQLEAGAGGGL